MLKRASIKDYEYYHLLSGVDFLIKSQDYIHDFFNEHKNMNFIDLDPMDKEKNYKLSRIKEYHFFQNKIGRQSGKLISIFYKLEKISIILQKYFNIERYKEATIDIKKGAQWFSINNLMVKEILDNEKLIKKYFYYSICADEMFLQSIAYS